MNKRYLCVLFLSGIIFLLSSCQQKDAADSIHEIIDLPDTLHVKAGASSSQHRQYINSIMVHWDKVKDAKRYHLYRARTLEGLYWEVTPQGGINSRSFLDTDVVHYGQYFYKIRVTLESGEMSPFSLPFSGVVATEAAIMDDHTAFVIYNGVDMIKSGENEFGELTAFFDIPSGMFYNYSLDMFYVTDEATGAISIFSGSNELLLSDKSEVFNSPRSAAVDDDGNVYVADTCNHRIVKLDRNLNEVMTWGTYGSGFSNTGEFNRPTGVALYGNNIVFVVDSLNFRIQVFSCVGTEVLHLGWFGKTQSQPVAEWRDGALDNTMLHEPGQPGSRRGALGGTVGLHGPGGIAVDRDGNIYVADTENHRVVKYRFVPGVLSGDSVYDYSGSIEYAGWWGWSGDYVDGYLQGHVGWHGTESDNTGNMPKVSDMVDNGSGTGAFLLPRNVAVDRQGYVYVSDYYLSDGFYARVQKFTHQGEFVAAFGRYGTSGYNSLAACSGLAVKNDGSVYVNDMQNSRITIFAKENILPENIVQQEVLALDVEPIRNPRESSDAVVSWLPISGVKAYHVYRAESFEGPFEELTPVNGTSKTAYTDTTIIHYKTYYYKIQADFTSGYSSYFSSIIEFIPVLDRNSYSYSSQVSLHYEAVPYGLAYTEDTKELAILDANLNSLTVVDKSGTVLRGLETDPQDPEDDYSYFRHPRGMAVDSNNCLYVADTENNRICRIDNNLGHTVIWTSFGDGNYQFNHPTGVACFKNYLLVVDSLNCRVVVLHVDGESLEPAGWYGSSGGATGSWNTNFTLSPKQGKGDGAFSLSENGERGAVGIAIDSQGFVYVADTYNHRIQKFYLAIITGTNGTDYTSLDYRGWWGFDGYSAAWHNPGSGLNGTLPSNFLDMSDGQLLYPRGVAVDGNGYVYVSDYHQTYCAHIIKFSHLGEPLTAFGMYGSAGRSYLDACNGVTTALDGSIFVADSGNHRVAVFKK